MGGVYLVSMVTTARPRAQRQKLQEFPTCGKKKGIPVASAVEPSASPWSPSTPNKPRPCCLSTLPSHSSSNPGDWSSLLILTAGLGRGRVIRASPACLRLSFRAVFNSGMNVPSWCTQAASVAVIDAPGVNTSAMFSAAGGQAVSLFYAGIIYVPGNYGSRLLTPHLTRSRHDIL